MSPFFWQTSSGLFRSSFIWELTIPILTIGLIAFGFTILIGLQWIDLRTRVDLKVQWGLCLLRTLAYAVIILMLLNPTLVIQRGLRLLPNLAVVLDTSGSMALSNNMAVGTTNTSRLQRALDYLQTGSPTPLDQLQEHYEVNLYQFDDTIRPLSSNQLSNLKSTGQSTDIPGSLTTLLEEKQTTPPAGVFLFSDGAHHAPDTSMGYLRQATIPIVAVGLGTPNTYRDIQVVSVQAPSLTFLHYPVTIQATLKIWGYRNESIPVVLKRAGRVVATQTIHITNPDGNQQVSFEILPEDIGEFTYMVSVAPRLGESLTTNNVKTFPLSVARDKIRVLLVCGSPTWNYRFLRQALKQDPSVDLISFVILRTRTDVVNVPESQLSLIPFPTRRLFTQELQNFDLIIFENFSFQSYFPWYYLENVRTYVNEGGSFAMVGGRLAFAQGGYAGTPIEDILPVVLRKNRNDYRPVTQRMQLTPAGMVHPITRLVANPEENRRIWKELTELDALNVVAQTKPNATVLGVSTGKFGNSVNVPLLAVQHFGKGRTLALMTDYTWKWNFQMAGQMDSNRYYLQFIRQLARWLIRDPELKQVRIMAHATEFPLGSEISGTIQVLQDNYLPDTNANLSVTIRPPSGMTQPVQAVPTTNPGEFRYRFRANEIGLASLDVQATIGQETQETNRLLLRVYHPGNEQRNAAPNHSLLQDIASSTSGAFFTLQDTVRPSLSSLIEFFGGTPNYKVLEETSQRLRETFVLFLLLLVCLAIEWWWRRRVGLL